MNKPYIWMDDLGTWFTDEDYQELDESLQDGLVPLYKENEAVKESNKNLMELVTMLREEVNKLRKAQKK